MCVFIVWSCLFPLLVLLHPYTHKFYDDGVYHLLLFGEIGLSIVLSGVLLCKFVDIKVCKSRVEKLLLLTSNGPITSAQYVAIRDELRSRLESNFWKDVLFTISSSLNALAVFLTAVGWRQFSFDIFFIMMYLKQFVVTLVTITVGSQINDIVDKAIDQIAISLIGPTTASAHQTAKLKLDDDAEKCGGMPCERPPHALTRLEIDDALIICAAAQRNPITFHILNMRLTQKTVILSIVSFLVSSFIAIGRSYYI